MKIYYYDIFGRAESIRMILSHAKVHLEEVKINGEKLADMKVFGVLEFGQVPLLETANG